MLPIDSANLALIASSKGLFLYIRVYNSFSLALILALEVDPIQILGGTAVLEMNLYYRLLMIIGF